MKKLLGYEEFLNEDELNEETVEDYQYHFRFEGKRYTIHQGEKDKTLFGIKSKDGDWFVVTKGKLFAPDSHDKHKNEMIELIQRGIKYFNVRNPVEKEDVEESEWAKFFDFELKKKPGRINKKYVVLKLHCGKAQCKYLSR